jgi:hypothetical protein
MDANKKQDATAVFNVRADGLQSHEAASIWWTNWAKSHSEQIEAYNKDVAENGVWSDELRSF